MLVTTWNHQVVLARLFVSGLQQSEQIHLRISHALFGLNLKVYIYQAEKLGMSCHHMMLKLQFEQALEHSDIQYICRLGEKYIFKAKFL